MTNLVMATPTLEAIELRKVYPTLTEEIVVLESVSFSMQSGENLAIVGTSRFAGARSRPSRARLSAHADAIRRRRDAPLDAAVGGHQHRAGDVDEVHGDQPLGRGHSTVACGPSMRRRSGVTSNHTSASGVARILALRCVYRRRRKWTPPA